MGRVCGWMRVAGKGVLRVWLEGVPGVWLQLEFDWGGGWIVVVVCGWFGVGGGWLESLRNTHRSSRGNHDGLIAESR